MPFEVIPAIDLRGGKCVRLFQGDYAKETIYGDDPVEMALHWQELGATRLHVVDLDGARSGHQANSGAVRAIVNAVSIPVELGGGVRDLDVVSNWLRAGVERVFLGTVAVTDHDLAAAACKRFAGHVAAGADARDGRIAVRGWEVRSAETVVDFARRLLNDGACAISYTNIALDGTLSGPDIAGTRKLLQEIGPTDAQIILSGGVASITDVVHAAEVPGLGGVIIGRALYEGTVDLAEALDVIARMEA
ncbi:MAG TPA: 1-(5-phosphoribosyl)-5-[(5-phosphoribosylamino)methylideneamino]imidazole-4-carboxamide isomerase [Dehalococcoidia bacterium]|nr:1-(5-phosphoribosyl)-5-[(5-phosphoribosylamino)methylideneamino]imidazole-4-carboxamide isomerase [Dehalococcoidia bacterium]